MKSPRLPHYFHLPIVLLMLAFVASVAWTVYYGFGAWTHNRMVNGTWFRDRETRICFQMSVTLLPTLIGSFYFLRRFVRREDVHLFYSLLITIGAVLLSLAIIPLLH